MIKLNFESTRTKKVFSVKETEEKFKVPFITLEKLDFSVENGITTILPKQKRQFKLSKLAFELLGNPTHVAFAESEGDDFIINSSSFTEEFINENNVTSFKLSKEYKFPNAKKYDYFCDKFLLDLKQDNYLQLVKVEIEGYTACKLVPIKEELPSKEEIAEPIEAIVTEEIQ